MDRKKTTFTDILNSILDYTPVGPIINVIILFITSVIFRWKWILVFIIIVVGVLFLFSPQTVFLQEFHDSLVSQFPALNTIIALKTPILGHYHIALQQIHKYGTNTVEKIDNLTGYRLGHFIEERQLDILIKVLTPTPSPMSLPSPVLIPIPIPTFTPTVTPPPTPSSTSTLILDESSYTFT